MKAKIALLVVVVASVVLVSRAWSPEGIVTVPGWEHGVALCHSQDRTYNESVKEIDGGNMWVSNGIMYVVNDDHMGDDELVELIKWAQHECAQYQN